MAEENVDLNPISLGGEIKKKRPRPIPVAPLEGNLLITAYSIVLKGGTDTFTKSRFSREVVINDAQKFVCDSTTESPSIFAGTLHGLLIDKFGSMARDVIAKINSGDGEITEQSLVGDSRADYQVSLQFVPLFFCESSC